MKKILLCCSAGMSTSTLVKKMTDYARKEGLEWTIEAMSMQEAKSVVDQWDIVMVGPQVSYALGDLKKLTDKPVEVIPANIYALAKAKEACEMAIRMLG
ncbi:PTS sugar transporter subunit IIB [Spiroplasma alleghenense]|uniref:PTS system, cellobiose-specific IIB component n=1 Tax=Spiroplasma alleghenense TaxID=216931 RepID=A0A345Z4I7_9MOLU|nr:PTS sugar transporter subunit IIB [Spiroplasma alleghenense]AXK51516.1 PTS system, cellobiose-specific IIB component [Spiroplasma alleghenense]